MLVSYRLGDMWAPQLDNTEALQTEALHFIDCIEHNKQPETDGTSRTAHGELDRSGRNLAARSRPVD
jgi:hypothetical protein